MLLLCVVNCFFCFHFTFYLITFTCLLFTYCKIIKPYLFKISFSINFKHYIFNAVAASWSSTIRGTSVPFLLTLVMFFFLGVYNSPDLQFELLLVLGYLWMNKEAISGTEIRKVGDYDRNQEINFNWK